MAEVKKLYRKEYRAKRKKYMLYQQIGLAFLAVLLLIFSIVYFKTNKAAYVHYSEDGKAVHYAHLTEKGQEYYGVDKLNGSHAYVSTLIEIMSADFSYGLKFDTTKVKYTYTYGIETQLEVLDVASGAPLYNPVVCTQVKPTVVSGEGNAFSIAEHVEIDFSKYNQQASDFIGANNLKDTASSLIVRLSVSVVGASDSFVADHTDKYVTEVRIPLCKLAFKPTVSSTIPAGEKKILAVSGNARTFFGVLSIVSLVAFIADACVYVFFVLHTRDNYIDYALKVSRIRKNYKSYIQRIEEEYPTEGSKVLHLGEFTELLEIRDVVQKPILMYENEGRTCTKFVISSDGLIYMYEIEVEPVEITNTDKGGAKGSETALAAEGVAIAAGGEAQSADIEEINGNFPPEQDDCPEE